MRRFYITILFTLSLFHLFFTMPYVAFTGNVAGVVLVTTISLIGLVGSHHLLLIEDGYFDEVV